MLLELRQLFKLLGRKESEDEFASIVQNNGFELQKITKVDQYISSPSDGLKILKSIN